MESRLATRVRRTTSTTWYQILVPGTYLEYVDENMKTREASESTIRVYTEVSGTRVQLVQLAQAYLDEVCLSLRELRDVHFKCMHRFMIEIWITQTSDYNYSIVSGIGVLEKGYLKFVYMEL